MFVKGLNFVRSLRTCVLVLSCCGLFVEPYEVVQTTSSTLPASSEAEYTCIIRNLWTQDRHPNNFPASARLTPAILVVHSESYSVWEENALASAELNEMAEV